MPVTVRGCHTRQASPVLKAVRAIVGEALIMLCGLALLASSGAKLARVRRIVDQLESYGFRGRVGLIGLGEAASALLFLVPPTRPLGLLLVSALLGGAIATHMQHGRSYLGPAAILVLVWLAVWLHGDLSLSLAGVR